MRQADQVGGCGEKSPFKFQRACCKTVGLKELQGPQVFKVNELESPAKDVAFQVRHAGPKKLIGLPDGPGWQAADNVELTLEKVQKQR